jgi:hypothetical protein
MRRRASSAAEIYQIKVTLKGIKPPIWRRIQVPASITLPQLHRVLQVVMGWEDYHLHQFTIAHERYGEPDPDFADDMINENRVRLGQVIRGEKARFLYEYDFGDSWEHELLIEKILPPDPAVPYPVCLTGKRHCPPEDVGGVWGYPGFLEAIRDPEHREHKEMLQWVGGEFDPEEFDLEDVNAGLRRMHGKRI